MDAWSILQALAPTASGDAWELFNNTTAGDSVVTNGDGMNIEIEDEQLTVTVSDDAMVVEIIDDSYEIEIDDSNLEVPII